MSLFEFSNNDLLVCKLHLKLCKSEKNNFWLIMFVQPVFREDSNFTKANEGREFMKEGGHISLHFSETILRKLYTNFNSLHKNLFMCWIFFFVVSSKTEVMWDVNVGMHKYNWCLHSLCTCSFIQKETISTHLLYKEKAMTCLFHF